MKDIVSYVTPKSIITESIKILRTSLQFSNVDKPLKTIAITSSIQGEGKSFISSNLAVAFAGLEKRVLIVDTDMRRGTLHRKFGVTNADGLSDLLVDENLKYEKYIKKTDMKDLYVITAGTVPPNPSELISSNKFEKFLSDMKEMFDLIIFDTPPVTVVPETCIVASKSDKTIIVACIKVTNVDDLEKTKKMLENSGACIAGAVVNKTKISSKKYYSKYYN